MAEESGGERTERATGKRRSEARNKGTVAKSQEVNGAILILIGVTALLASSGHISRILGRNTAYLLGQAHIFDLASPYGVRDVLTGNLEVIGAALAPILLAVLVAAVGANLLQVGFHASAEALQFKADKLNPLPGLKKFFQKSAFFELGKNLVKITLITVLATTTIQGLMGTLGSASLFSVPAIVSMGKIGFMKLMAKLLAFTLVLALLDWFWQKHQYEENLKMSKHEVKQENKDIEGDPQIRARIKGLQYEMARQRMLADVPTADVVVTNPTHFAVALKYREGEAAPVVVAKGMDHVAQTIKEIARKARVPIIENKPLARSLYRQVDVGRMIPDSLYQAVAEVLAYVYRLKKS